MNDIKKIIGKNIIELRKKHGLTQAELAEKINYSDKAISKWECGDAVPDIATLKMLANLLGVSVDYLLENEHIELEKEPEESRIKKRNKVIITLLSATLVWMIATIVFTVLNIGFPLLNNTWHVFMYAVPLTAIVFLVFNSIWGNKRFNFAIITVLMWTSLACVYIALLEYNIWIVFILGIPAQLIIALWSGLRKN